MKPLRLVLAANTLSNLGFGSLFSLWPAAVAAWLGTVPPDAIFWIGIGLLLNGTAMLATTLRSEPRPRDVVLFSVGDMGWWLFSMTLIAAQVWVTTPHGLAATWTVALIVAALGLAQLYILGQHRFGDTGRGPHQRFVTSWLALPLWVKIWLFGLNAVFLAAPLFLSAADSHVVLTVFVACVPLLLALAYPLGGLNRLVGLGHLIPWTPLLIWLIWHLPDPLPYTALLIGVIAICLAFDIYDVIRWLRGDRAIMGQAAPRGTAQTDPMIG